MIKNRHGFTIVEVTIAVTIIAILASISIVMYSRVQVDVRNNDRGSKVDVIAGALEKYYSKNGEYPSCSAMTQSATQVSATVLPGIEKGALLVPGSAAGVTNSISCTALSAGAGPDVFAYVGDGSSTCSTGAACLKYTLQYRKEGTNEVVAKDSEHAVGIGTSVPITLVAQSASSTQVNLSWNSVPNAIQYKYQRATNVDFTTSLVESTTSNVSASASGLSVGTTYYFRVLAVAAGSEGNWSNTASVASVVAQPTSVPIVTATMNGTNAEGTASVVTCPAGTAQYQMHTRNSPTSTMNSWTAWNAWSTTRTLSVAGAQGYQYGFQAKARCLVGGTGSTSTADSNIATTVRLISTPVVPTYLTPASFNSPASAVVNFSGVCPTNTTRSDATFRSLSWAGAAWSGNPWGYTDQWTNNTGSNKVVEYWGKYKCKTYWTTSDYSLESHTNITVTP